MLLFLQVSALFHFFIYCCLIIKTRIEKKIEIEIDRAIKELREKNIVLNNGDDDDDDRSFTKK